jgi:predicted sugar kinase
MIVGVRAFSRLHFGLMEICPGQPHRYGGIGVMIDSPAMIVEATLGSLSDPSSIAVQGDSYWVDRSHRAIRAWKLQNPASSIDVDTLRVIEPPVAHVGLGSGTQWACSIAAVLHMACIINREGKRDRPGIGSPAGGWTARELFVDAEALALQAGRGLRSHVGTEGFRSGGVIVDWGQTPREANEVEAHRTEVLAIPESWRIVTIGDRSCRGESGVSELEKFEKCSLFPNPDRSAMVRAIREEMIPSFRDGDWKAASDAIGRYGECAGRIFAPEQGGIYRSNRIAEIVDRLRRIGIEGSGQSSWGPTVFALAHDEDQARWIVDQLKKDTASHEALIGIARIAPPALLYGSASSS